MNISKENFTELAKKHLIALESYKMDENGNKPIEIFGIEKLYEAINVIQCCKSDSELLPSKDDVYSEIKRVTELYYNDDNVRKSAFGLGFSTGVNFINKDILK